MSKTWFLPPDFTFTTDGPLRLGMVISHWSKPTSVLVEIGSGDSSAIKLPAIKSVIESNRAFNRSKLRTNSVGFLAKFQGLFSSSASTEAGKCHTTDYSKTDHEVRFFADPLLPETVEAIANLPAVQKSIQSGLFPPCAVYVVTGLRITNSSFTVTEEDSSKSALEAEGSGPPSGTVPGEIGGNMKHESGETSTDSYNTAPGIVFAYRLSVIRTQRAGVETELFTHKDAFLTGNGGKKEGLLVLVDATTEEINEDLEVEIEYDSAEIGEDEDCVFVLPKA